VGLLYLFEQRDGLGVVEDVEVLEGFADHRVVMERVGVDLALRLSLAEA
jgi:hypothetical protein